MQILNSIPEACAAVRRVRAKGQTFGLVPTMGALHAGHLSLVHAARASCDAVAVSIFVNPTQFAPHEDLARYPRTFEADCEALRDGGVDLLFAPAAEEMYPPGASTFVEVAGVSDRLDGASRPGHFRGVATVVAKLWNIFAPDRAFFGQKDAAQVAVLRRMARDLNFGVEVVVCPTVREGDGLAMSSRNAYLSPAERSHALALSRSLAAAQALFAAGEESARTLEMAARTALGQEPMLKIDYVAVVDPETLFPLEVAGSGSLLAVAAWVGATRLIDNVLL